MTYQALVFFDLDNTLLNTRLRVEENIQNALTGLRENNILPIISTGRSPAEIKIALKQSNIDTCIFMNGAYITYKNRPIYRGQIDTKLIQDIYERAERNGDALGFYNEHKFRITRETKSARQHYRAFNSPLPIIDPQFYKNNIIYMLLIIADKNYKYYSNIYGNQLNFFRTSSYSMDTVLKNESKQSGITKLIDAMNFKDIPTYAFGDGINDLPMFKAVDHSIAMGNSIETVKKQAEYITTKNTEGGIIQGLHHFNLL